MPQYDMNSELNTFYESHVRLKDEFDRLRSLRDTNLKRLDEGLQDMGRPTFAKSLLQGSIAMHTANKSTNNDYDIDIAVIFEEDDLPSSPLEARKRVAEAIKRKASGFSQDPEARTNAVTIWYSVGYHVDIAVYRRRENWLGQETIEHAGADWTPRNPKEVTNWFIGEVASQSPENGLFITPQVAPKQMRRIVRWIKAFTKAREGWNLPGGFIISTLVAECYQPHNDRDDIALYETLRAIESRLKRDCTVYNPVDGSQELTDKPKFSKQVKNLRRRLGSVLSKLAVLFDENCNKEKASKAWHYIFQHPFWTPQASANASQSQANHYPYDLQLAMDIAGSKGGFIKSENIRSGRFLPKKVHLRFRAQTNITPPYTVMWEAINSGDEAEAANDMGHQSTSRDLMHWEHTLYRGRHELVCKIVKAGEVQATAKHVVNIR